MPLPTTAPASKKFVYLIQSRTWHKYFNDLVTDDSDCVVLFFDPCKTYTHPKITSLYYGKNSDGRRSGWNEGRNALYNQVKEKGYEYFIFLDDDVFTYHKDGLNPYRYLELMLNLVKPACAVANYDCHLWDKKDFDPEASVQTIRATDAIFYAMHKDAAKLLLPYPEKWETVNWWRSQNVINQLAMTYYKGDVVVFGKLVVKNSCHEEYPRQGHNDYAESEGFVLSQLPKELLPNWATLWQSVYQSHGEIKCNGDYQREKTIFIP